MTEIKYRRLLNASTLTELLSPLVKRSTNRVINDAIQLVTISINTRLEKMGWMNTLPSITVQLKKSEVAEEIGITMKQVSNALQVLRVAGIMTAVTKNDGRGWLNLWKIDFSQLKKSQVLFAKISYISDGKIIEEVKSTHAGFKAASSNLRSLKTDGYFGMTADTEFWEDLKHWIMNGFASFEEQEDFYKVGLERFANFKG